MIRCRYDIIALDADDTLWHNERLFQSTQREFCRLLSKHVDPSTIEAKLYEAEKRNLKHFGYGVKGFVLSMIDTAIEITNGGIDSADIKHIMNFGRSMLDAPIELLPGVQETVEKLSGEYRLMLLTKGDLFDQETKLARSGLGDHFSAIEIVSEKNRQTYENIMKRYSVDASRFVMVGNSLKSDVLPALEAGAAAVHIPHEITWALEIIPEELLEGHSFARLNSISELWDFLL